MAKLPRIGVKSFFSAWNLIPIAWSAVSSIVLYFMNKMQQDFVVNLSKYGDLSLSDITGVVLGVVSGVLLTVANYYSFVPSKDMVQYEYNYTDKNGKFWTWDVRNVCAIASAQNFFSGWNILSIGLSAFASALDAISISMSYQHRIDIIWDESNWISLAISIATALAMSVSYFYTSADSIEKCVEAKRISNISPVRTYQV